MYASVRKLAVMAVNSCPTENVDGLGPKVPKELHGYQIQHHLERPVDPVLGRAVLARVVVDDDLGDRSACLLDKCREEPVHLTVDLDVLDVLGTINLEGAAHVVEWDAGDVRDDPVRDLGGEAA